MPKITVIITTYNRPDALAIVLNALKEQQFSDFEVIVADDGSTEATADFIRQLSTPYLLKHVWQEDNGFQAAKARNLAVMAANGDYLIFLDGDCIPRIDFIAKHHQLAEAGYFVVGNRILLNEQFTQHILNSAEPIWKWPVKKWFLAYIQRSINRFSPLLRLPFMRKHCRQTWKGVKTCNLAVWSKDFKQVNGFDESFNGWGYEDSDLAIRLLQNGIKRKNGRFAVPVLHLWHPEEKRNQSNWLRLKKTINKL